MTHVVFLGGNDVGMEIYEWLCSRGSVSVDALVTEKSQLDLVNRLEPDIVVSVGYDHKVPPDVLEVPDKGCINLHPSFLPYNRGKSPNVWSIVDGTPAGVTLHYMAEEFDTGDIIERRRVETSFADDGRDLHERLERAQFGLFIEAWPDISAGNIDPVPQPPNEGTYHSIDDFLELCRLRPFEETTTKELLDRLRALTFEPFDNAIIEVDGEEYYVDVSITPADETDTNQRDGLLESYDET